MRGGTGLSSRSDGFEGGRARRPAPETKRTTATTPFVGIEYFRRDPDPAQGSTSHAWLTFAVPAVSTGVAGFRPTGNIVDPNTGAPWA